MSQSLIQSQIFDHNLCWKVIYGIVLLKGHQLKASLATSSYWERNWERESEVWEIIVHVQRRGVYFSDGCSRISQVDGIVYLLVDTTDKERFPESKKELDALLSDGYLSQLSFLVLGDKIDIPYAASKDELRYSLGLSNYTTGGKVNLGETNMRPSGVFMGSIVRKMGYGEKH